jgi:hypothetical protein
MLNCQKIYLVGITLKDYFLNKLPKLPKVNITFKAATKKGKKSHQEELEL